MLSASYTTCIYLIRVLSDTGISIANNAKLIILLVDQQSSYRILTECCNISESTDISVINFGCNCLNVSPGVHTYEVIDFDDAVKAVMSYYK